MSRRDPDTAVVLADDLGDWTVSRLETMLAQHGIRSHVVYGQSLAHGASTRTTIFVARRDLPAAQQILNDLLAELDATAKLAETRQAPHGRAPRKASILQLGVLATIVLVGAWSAGVIWWTLGIFLLCAAGLWWITRKPSATS